MKKAYLLAAVLFTAPISGCATIRTVAAIPQVCVKTSADEKAWYAAEALYNVPAALFRTANEHKMFDQFANGAALKAIAKEKLMKLDTYRVGARAAYKACDSVALGNYKAAMELLKAEVLPLIPS